METTPSDYTTGAGGAFKRSYCYGGKGTHSDEVNERDHYTWRDFEMTVSYSCG